MSDHIQDGSPSLVVLLQWGDDVEHESRVAKLNVTIVCEGYHPSQVGLLGEMEYT